MSDETALIAPPGPPMTEGEKRNLCYEFVLRMHKATKEYEDDLRGEFLCNKACQRDWQAMFDQLDYPLHLMDGSLFAVATGESDEEYLDFVDFKLKEAVQTLKSGVVAVNAIFAALDHVTDARFALAIWRAELLKAGAVRRRYDWSDPTHRQEWSQTFNTMIEELRQTVTDKQDLEICRHSRQVFLYREYLYIVAPDETAESRDAELIQLHQEAVASMAEGPAREHTEWRLKKLRRHDA